ncbi:hypothetical protein DNM18_26740 [Salmonella enterica subsp. enterica]|nr:hypothetical protein [Salmonella enterica subsp. enterica serovar Poona]
MCCGKNVDRTDANEHERKDEAGIKARINMLCGMCGVQIKETDINEMYHDAFTAGFLTLTGHTFPNAARMFPKLVNIRRGVNG